MGKLSQSHTPSFPNLYLLHFLSNKKPHLTHLWEDYLWLPHLPYIPSHCTGEGIGGFHLAQGTQLGRKLLHSNLGPLHSCGPYLNTDSNLCGSPREGIQGRPDPGGSYLWRADFVVMGSILNRGTTLLSNDPLRLKLSLWGKQHFNFQDSNKMVCVLTIIAMHAYEFSLSICLCIAVSLFVAINTLAFWIALFHLNTVSRIDGERRGTVLQSTLKETLYYFPIHKDILATW